MKKCVMLLGLCTCLVQMSMAMPATPVGFTDDLDAACREAKASNRKVFAVFSGSDWCCWCIRLEREVLSKPSFVQNVTNKVVLAFIDSPQDETLLSERARVANPTLVKKYGIRGFPTALILDGEGKVLAKTGYQRGGAEAYVKHLQGLMESLNPADKECSKK